MTKFNLEKNTRTYRAFTILIDLLYRCQCNCIHCAIANYSKKEKELSTVEVMKLIDQLPDVSKKLLKNRRIRVQFSGGEPLLRKDLPSLIKYSCKNGFEPQVNTNGLLLTEAMVEKLKKSGLKKIFVSIDSSNNEIHDKIRGVNGCFDAAVAGIRNCLERGMMCCISTCADGENIKNGELEKVILLGKKLGVFYIRIIPSVLSGKLLNREEKRPDQKDLRILEKLKKTYKDFIMVEGNFCGAHRKKCITISPYGDVLSCPYIPIAFGNTRVEPLINVLRKMFTHQIFKIKIKSGECLGNNRKVREKYLNTKQSKYCPIGL